MSFIEWVLRDETEKLLLEMSVVTDVTGIMLDRIHFGVDMWTDVYAVDDRCRDLKLQELVERLVRFWNYKGERGLGFSKDRKMTSDKKVQTFTVTYYSTYDSHMKRLIHIIRLGPESFKATKLHMQSGRNDHWADVHNDEHPKFYEVFTDALGPHYRIKDR